MNVSRLDKFYEADGVAVRSNGTPGSASRDFSLPAGEKWFIEEMGGSASIEQTEIELLYSEDNGSTWINPYDTGSKIRCLHLQNGGIARQRLGLWFIGGTNRKLRLLAKNYNTVNEAEIIGWLRGQINVDD